MKVNYKNIRGIIRELIKESSSLENRQVEIASRIITKHIASRGHKNPIRGSFGYFLDNYNSLKDPVFKKIVEKYQLKYISLLSKRIQSFLQTNSDNTLVAGMVFKVHLDIVLDSGYFGNSPAGYELKDIPSVKAVYDFYKSDIESIAIECLDEIDKRFQLEKPKYKNAFMSLLMPYAVITPEYAYDASFTREVLSQEFDSLRPVEIVNTVNNKKYTWDPKSGKTLMLPGNVEIYDVIPAEEISVKNKKHFSMIGYAGPHPISGKDFEGTLPMARESSDELMEPLR